MAQTKLCIAPEKFAKRTVNSRQKFYPTRHTFIILMVKPGADLKAIADHAATSVQMIEDYYCGESTIFCRSIFNNSPVTLASQTLPSWNPLISWLKELDSIRQYAVA